MMSGVRKLGGALWLTLSGAPRRARQQLYHGRSGLRILTFHDTPPQEFSRFCRLVELVREEFDVVGPEAAADLAAGRASSPARDQALFTFDDGFDSNYAAAEYLAKRKIRAIFFVVPSFLDRTMKQFLDFHRGQSPEAFRFVSSGGLRGLTKTQAGEMAAMGHLIAGHNYAHRDLAELTRPRDLEYEIDRALEAVAEITGRRCEDFAIGFGRPRNVSREAIEHLQRRCARVYSCVRGLNVPGLSPRLLLRDNTDLMQPLLFHRLSMRGGVDLVWAGEVEELKHMGGTLPAGNHAAA